LWRNEGAERFLANLRFWNYVSEPEPTRVPWEFDPQNPEQSIKSLGELRNIALLLVTELGFLSPPSLWYGNTQRPKKWGRKLMEGDFAAWKEVKRKSAQVWAAIFYPSEKRNLDFMLCVNKYSPLALTRIQDANVRDKATLEPICKSVGLQFGYTVERPLLFPQKPESCNLDTVRAFVKQLEQLKKKVGCSIRELGEIPRFG
jgi:hypothetical protein